MKVEHLLCHLCIEQTVRRRLLIKNLMLITTVHIGGKFISATEQKRQLERYCKGKVSSCKSRYLYEVYEVTAPNSSNIRYIWSEAVKLGAGR